MTINEIEDNLLLAQMFTSSLLEKVMREVEKLMSKNKNYDHLNDTVMQLRTAKTIFEYSNDYALKVFHSRVAINLYRKFKHL